MQRERPRSNLNSEGFQARPLDDPNTKGQFGCIRTIERPTKEQEDQFMNKQYVKKPSEKSGKNKAPENDTTRVKITCKLSENWTPKSYTTVEGKAVRTPNQIESSREWKPKKKEATSSWETKGKIPRAENTLQQLCMNASGDPWDATADYVEKREEAPMPHGTRILIEILK